MFRVIRITAMSTHLKNYFLQTRLADAVLDADPPAFDDVECCLACDSTAFYLDGKPIGTICVFRYDHGYRHTGGGGGLSRGKVLKIWLCITIVY